jgi:hypothetical protein
MGEAKVCAGYFMGKGAGARNMLLWGRWEREKAFGKPDRVRKADVEPSIL